MKKSSGNLLIACQKMFRRSIQIVTSKALATATRIVPKSQQFHSLVCNKPAKGSMSYLASMVKRELSTPSNPSPEEQTKEEKVNNEVVKLDYDEYDDYEPKTAGQKVAYYGTIFTRLGLLLIGLACIFVTGRELFPGRFSPNSLYSEVFDFIRYKEEIVNETGDSAKAFGRDVGRNTEGRRNHVDSYSYTEEDGSRRLRVRFNVKGNKGQVRVWAEISDKMGSSEYVYIICQNVRTGRVVTVVDNRDQMEANMLSSADDNSISKFFFKK